MLPSYHPSQVRLAFVREPEIDWDLEVKILLITLTPSPSPCPNLNPNPNPNPNPNQVKILGLDLPDSIEDGLVPYAIKKVLGHTLYTKLTTMAMLARCSVVLTLTLMLASCSVASRPYYSLLTTCCLLLATCYLLLTRCSVTSRPRIPSWCPST